MYYKEYTIQLTQVNTITINNNTQLQEKRANLSHVSRLYIK